jgi:ribosomal protein L40E
MSLLNDLGSFFCNFGMDSIKKHNKMQKYIEKKSKLQHKLLKYICNNCGAYNHLDQGYCGICKTTHLRKSTKEEREHTISLFEDLFRSEV